MTLTYYKGMDGDYIRGPGGCQRVWVVKVGPHAEPTNIDLLLCHTKAERQCGDLSLCAEHAAEWLANARAGRVQLRAQDDDVSPDREILPILDMDAFHASREQHDE